MSSPRRAKRNVERFNWPGDHLSVDGGSEQKDTDTILTTTNNDNNENN